MFFECMTNIGNDGSDATGVVGLVEMRKDVPDLLVPESLTYLLMDSAVTKDGKLSVLECDIDENAVAGGGVFHLKNGEHLGGAIERVDVAAMPLDIHPDLSAGAFFGRLDGSDNGLLLGLVEEGLALE